TPHGGQCPTVRRWLNVVRAVSGNDDASIRQLEVRYKGRQIAFDGRPKARKPVRGGQIIRNSWPRTGRDRQREVDRPLAHEPHSRATIAGHAEELESGDVGQRRSRRVGGELFVLHHLCHRGLRGGRLAEKAGRLLPFAVEIDVAEVSAAEVEERQ